MVKKTKRVVDEDEDGDEEVVVRKKKKRVVEDEDEAPVKKKKKVVVEEEDEDDEEELKEAANEESANESVTGGGSSRISTKDGSYTLGDQDLGSEMDCVVVRVVHFRQWFATGYNKNKPAPPDCFALGVTSEDMRPHKNSSDPQAKVCAKCPHSKIVDGNPPDCATKRRLALLHSDDIETVKDVKKAEMPYLEIPYTSIKKYWAPYLTKLKDSSGLPPYAVLTHLELTDSKLTKFTLESKLTIAIRKAIEARRDEALAMLLTPFAPKTDDGEDDDDKPKKKKKLAKPVKKTKRVAEEDEDEEDDEDEDDEEEDEKPKKKVKKKVVEEDDDEEDSEEDDDEDEEEEDEDDEEEKPSKKVKKKKKAVEDEDDEEEEDDDEDEDDEEEDDEDEDDEDEDDDEKPVKRRSRFSKK